MSGLIPSRSKPAGNLFAGAVRAKDLAKDIAPFVLWRSLRGSRIGEGPNAGPLPRAMKEPDPKRS